MVYSVVKIISFCYGHRLLHYAGKCKNLHGHNAKVEICFQTRKLDICGMVLDFTKIKKEIGLFIEENLDHKLLINKKDPLLKLFQASGQSLFIMNSNPTAENIAKLIFDFAKKKKFPVHSVKFWETETSYALVQES